MLSAETVYKLSYLQETVKAKLEEKNLKQIELARQSGISRSVLSKLLAQHDDPRKLKQLDFESVFSIFRVLEPLHYLDFMDEYCRTLDKPFSILNALEFASNFKRDNLLQDLVAEHSSRKGELKDWLKIYNLNLNKLNHETDDVLETCKEYYGKVNSKEIKIKIDMIEATLLYKKDYHSLLKNSLRIEKKVNALNDGFIKESFRVRLYTYQANAELYVNKDYAKAIEYASYVTKSKLAPELLIASAYHTIGQANMFISKEVSIDYLNKAANLFSIIGYENMGETLLKNDVPFVKNMHNEIFDIDDLTGEELAHQFIIRGEMKKAISVLNGLEEESAFSVLYRGMAEKDLSQMLKGHGMIVKTGKTFFLKYFEDRLAQLIKH